MIIIFLDRQGFIYQHVVEGYKTIIGEYYKVVLGDVTITGNTFSQEMPREKCWTFVAPPRQCTPAYFTGYNKFLDENPVQRLPHPAYNPDIAPCHFRLFFQLKKNIYVVAIILN